MFDGSATSREPPALEIGPGAGGDAAGTDRAESEGFALVFVFEVHAFQFGLDRGGPVVLELVDGEIRIRTVPKVVVRAQAMTRALLGDAADISADALIAARRREAARK